MATTAGRKLTPAKDWPRGSELEQTHFGSGRIEFERPCAGAWASASHIRRPREARFTQDQTDPPRGFHDRNATRRQNIAQTISIGRGRPRGTEHDRAATVERT